MSRRSDRAEGTVGFASVEAIDRIEARACREQCSLERLRTRARVGVEATAPVSAEPLHTVDVRRVVYPAELVAGGGPRRERDERLTQVGRLDSSKDCIETSRALRMPATSDVIEVTRMGRKQHRHDRRGYPSVPNTYAARGVQET
jgi:hypothetical protein